MIDTTKLTYADFRKNQQTFKSEDGKIKYIDRGEGEVIVLLHGVPTSGWLYRKMIDSLVNGGNRVIVPDMLGFGSSDSPKGYDLYNPKEHGKRLLALMDHLKVENWNHVFHDAGGLWTWELCKLAPDRIKKLIVLNSIIYEKGFNPPMRFERGGLTKLSVSFYSNKLTNKTYIGAVLVMLGALITVLVNVLYIPRYGYVASAWGHLFCYSTMVIVSYFWSRKHYPIPYRAGRILAYILVAIAIYLSNELFLQNVNGPGNLWSLLLLIVFGATVVLGERRTFNQYKAVNVNESENS